MQEYESQDFVKIKQNDDIILFLAGVISALSCKSASGDTTRKKRKL